MFRVPSAKRFSDPNELISLLFSELMNPSMSPLTQESLEQRRLAQDDLRQALYISCWTKTHNSIAMWEIYSPHRTSVQVEVEMSELEQSFNDYARQRCYTQAHCAPADHPETYFYPPEVGCCNYADISAVHNKLKAKTEAFHAAAGAAIDDGKKDEFELIYKEACGEAEKNFRDLFLLKDCAYDHEKEVRFCLRAVRRNNRPYEECAKDRFFTLFDSHLRPTTCDETGENIFIPFSPSLIKQVYLDGRTPGWLAEVQGRLLRGHGFEVSRSTAYGAFFDRNPIRKWWD